MENRQNEGRLALGFIGGFATWVAAGMFIFTVALL